MLIKVGLDPLHQAHTKPLMCNFAATETQGNLGLVALTQKTDQVTQLDVVITLIRTGPELDFLDLNLLLFKSGIVLFLALGILKLAII